MASLFFIIKVLNPCMVLYKAFSNFTNTDGMYIMHGLKPNYSFLLILNFKELILNNSSLYYYLHKILVTYVIYNIFYAIYYK